MYSIFASRSILFYARCPSNASPLRTLRRNKSSAPSLVPTIVSYKVQSTVTNHASLGLQHIPELNRPDTLDCWVDASPKNGLVAVVIGNTYKNFRLKDGWQEPGRDNHWAEMVAFELLVQVLLECRYSGHATIHSDSIRCLDVWRGGKTNVKSIKECNERLQATRMFWSFTTKTEWVSGKDNLADAFSRGRPVLGYAELQIAVTIPLALQRFICYD